MVAPGRILTVSLIVLAACGGPPGASALVNANAPTRGTSALEAEFDDAAREFLVPVELLKAVAYVETRVSPETDLSTVSGGFGMMNIISREDWNMLARARALTGASEETLRHVSAVNIRGAAAVLRELGEQSFGQYSDLSAHRLGDWFHAVSLYPGIDSAELAADYASDVFDRLDRGFELSRPDGTVVLAPTPSDWRAHAPAFVRHDAVKEYPNAAQWIASPNYTSGHGAYDFVLIHTTQGSYAGTLSWFQNTSAKVSSHYVVRSSDGQVTQMVEHRNTAWHAQCYNSRSIGIEHEGFVADPGKWYTAAMYQSSANLTRWIADRHGIPKTRSHIIGHVEVAPNCNTGGHTDPGPGWNWTHYMQLVTGAGPTTTTGTLIGVIYTGGNSNNRVAGAEVTLNTGAKATSDSTGVYQFNLAPGTYTATVSKAGYGSASVSKAVTAGAQTWGSMEINPQAAGTGVLRGRIFVANAANPTDTSQPIAGVSVTAGGQSQTTDAAGNYTFNLAPGTYTATATKAGYAVASVTKAVTTGATIWGSMWLTTSGGADAVPPDIAVTFPPADAQMDVAVVTLTGTASDDKGPLTKVSVSLNGGPAQDAPVANGMFQLGVTLKPGTNSIVVSGTDAAGNKGNATSSATFTAGLVGFVYQSQDGIEQENVRIPNATVELRVPGTQALVTSATTDSTGAYALSVAEVPADFVVVVKAAGYLTKSETVTVPADRRLSVNFGIVPGSDPTGEKGIEFTDPAEGAVINADNVTVYGTVTGMELVGVKVNGVTAELLGAGGFSAVVPLQIGQNSLEAVATGTQAESATKVLHVVRRPKDLAANVQSLQPVTGGCSAVEGTSMLSLLGLAALARRRRR